MRRILAITLFAVALVVPLACADDPTSRSEPSKNTSSDKAGRGSGNDSPETTSSTEEATLSPTDGEATRDAGLPEGTLKEKSEKPEVVLRLEGTPKTAFRGLCTVGDRDEVLGGKVPKRFTFDLQGQELNCRIQKQGSGGGALRVILLDGDRTRSVQSTQTSGGTITLAYDAG